jgi:hypothetical protein
MPLRVSVIKDYDGEEVVFPEPVGAGEAAMLPSLIGGPSDSDLEIPVVHTVYCTTDDLRGLIYRLDEPDINYEYDDIAEMIERGVLVGEVHFLGRVEVPIPLGKLAVHHFMYQYLN